MQRVIRRGNSFHAANTDPAESAGSGRRAPCDGSSDGLGAANILHGAVHLQRATAIGLDRFACERATVRRCAFELVEQARGAHGVAGAQRGPQAS